MWNASQLVRRSYSMAPRTTQCPGSVRGVAGCRALGTFRCKPRKVAAVAASINLATYNLRLATCDLWLVTFDFYCRAAASLLKASRLRILARRQSLAYCHTQDTMQSRGYGTTQDTYRNLSPLSPSLQISSPIVVHCSYDTIHPPQSTCQQRNQTI